MEYSFSNREKLKSRKRIDNIFIDGHTVIAYPIKIQFIFCRDLEVLCQVGVSVPKRNFKFAVDRNRIKRQLKEIYRLHKNLVLPRLEEAEKQMAMMIIYLGKEKPNYDTLSTAVLKAINKILFY